MRLQRTTANGSGGPWKDLQNEHTTEGGSKMENAIMVIVLVVAGLLNFLDSLSH